MNSVTRSVLKWLSEISGEKVDSIERASYGDVVAFILLRMRPGVFSLNEITDGIDRFARVTNWRLVNRTMRKMGMKWDFDEVKLVMAEPEEICRLVLVMRRWETRNLHEPLEPPSPDDWDENEIPQWFTQTEAKEIEERRLAAGESYIRKDTTKKPLHKPPYKPRPKRPSFHEMILM